MALRLVVTKSAIPDLYWFRIYYEDYFPEGMAKANARFEKCARLLCQRPGMGRPTGKPLRLRFSVPDTPYTIVYQHKEETLEILRVLDQRKETYLEDLFDT
jgi:plasmid stabilization system protein ParE